MENHAGGLLVALLPVTIGAADGVVLFVPLVFQRQAPACQSAVSAHARALCSFEEGVPLSLRPGCATLQINHASVSCGMNDQVPTCPLAGTRTCKPLQPVYRLKQYARYDGLTSSKPG